MTLSELLIALFLSALLCALLLSQYASLCQNSSLQRRLFHKQFEQSLLAELIRDTIHQAGFLPCGSQSSFDIWDASQSQWIHQKALVLKPDSLTTRYLDAQYHSFKTNADGQFIISDRTGLDTKHMVLLTNCFYSELNRIRTFHSLAKNHAIKFAFPSRFVIDGDSYIGRWHNEQLLYKQSFLYFGDKKKERVTSDVRHWHIHQKEKHLIQIAWQFEQLPPVDLFVWMTNVSTR